ncbi:MAG: electron transfer flavoprotein subunit alpha/FixB family protein, partial [Pedobacter sp.]
MSVLVYVENAEGKFKKSTFEVVSYAAAIANQLNTGLTAISIGDVKQEDLSNLGKYGASKVLNVSGDKLKSFVNQAYASIIAEAAQKEQADVVVLSNSFSGKGLAPRIAVKLKAGLADAAVELPETDNNKFIIKRTAFSGKAFANVELNSQVKVIALNPNAYQVNESGSAAKVEDFQANVKDSDFGTMITEIVRASNKIA